MVAALLLCVVGQYNPQYYPYADRAAAISSHYRHVSPLNGRVFISPSPSIEYPTWHRVDSLTPAQLDLPHLAAVKDAWEHGLIAGWVQVEISVRINGSRLIPGVPADESLFDSRWGKWGG